MIILNDIPLLFHLFYRDRRGRDRVLIGFKTTYAVSSYHH